MAPLAAVRAVLQAHPLPGDFTAVFAGGTSGIGEAAVLALAAHLPADAAARIYIVGRNEAAAEAIIARCRQSSPGSTFTFLQQDLRLLADVDRVCTRIAASEDRLDLLFMTTGYLSVRGRNGKARKAPLPPQ